MAHFDYVEDAALFIADLGLTFSDGNTEFSIEKGGETFWFPVQRPDGFTTPDAFDSVRQLVEDALLASRGIDAFAVGRGITKPSQAVSQFEQARKVYDLLRYEFFLSYGDLFELRDTLASQSDAVREGIAAILSERSAEQERTHPKVPEGFVSIEDLQAGLDLGDWGERCAEYAADDVSVRFDDVAKSYVDLHTYDLLKWLPDHYEWIETAYENDRLAGTEGDLPRMIQAAQEEYYRTDLYDHREDICKHVTLESLKDAGLYAVSDKVVDALEYIDYANADAFEGLTDEAMDVINNAMDEDMVEKVFYELAPSFYTIGEDSGLMADYNAIRDANGFNFPNNCAMSADMVREVNENGLEAAIHDFWKPVVTEAVENEPGIHYVVPQSRPSLKDAAQECRASASELEQGAPALDEPARDGEEH